MIINATGNANYNAIEVSAHRTRLYGETRYWVTVAPVMVDGICKRSMAFDGWKHTLATSPRASKKAESEAVASAEKWIPMLIERVCSDKNMELLDAYDPSTIVFKVD